MRGLIIVAGSCLALSACGDNSATDAGANVGANLAAEAIFANDTTVIDAATGDASNMAADVAYNVDADISGDVRSDGKIDRQTLSRRPPAQTQTGPSSDEPADTPMETTAETNAL